ncbi:MAG: hypothetical protein H8J66_04795 [Nitrospira sp.]|nr:hypothetical protein [Nitrospira sp.]
MYAAAADAINDRYPNALHVLSHTLGMAIELALKAFLVHHGLTEKDLRRLGHDLAELLKEAESYGLTSTGSRHFRLSVLGANYEERIFAYPAEGMLAIITPASLREIAHEIICEAFDAVKGTVQLQALAGAPGLAIHSHYPDDLNASAWAESMPRP